jgi:DNA-binding winged helix-turn-helix (wHTH) protein/TolB-like protein
VLARRQAPMTSTHHAFRFADYTFDADTGELVGPGAATRLQPQPAKVLAALLARPGELVTRDELKQIVWPDTVVEADQGLNFCVRQIRAALSDEADAGRFIETLPRRGYRFVAPVSNSRPDPGSPPQQLSASQPPPRRSPTISRRTAGVWIGAAIVLATIAAVWLGRAPEDSPRDDPHRLRLAILPFVAPAAESWMLELNQELTDRLVAELTLADSGRFAVVGPVTTAPYAGYTRPHTELGAKLGVDLVLSGGIRSRDSTLFLQVIRVSDGAHVVVWREKVYKRAPEEIVASVIAAARDGIRPHGLRPSPP